MSLHSTLVFQPLARLRRVIFSSLALILAGSPAFLQAQYSEVKMGEYLHYAYVAANGGIYAGIDGIGYTGVGYGTPSVYQPSNGWVDLPSSMGFNTARPYFGQPRGISHDGSVVAGYMAGEVTNGFSVQYAVYWSNGVESIVPPPPDDPAPTLMSATGVSGDGTTLIVEDQTTNGTESFVFNAASGTFTSLGFLGGTNHQTFATAINKDGTIVAGYYDLDDGTTHGFTWTAASGLTDLGIPVNHPNTYYLQPTCISDDGSTLFGQLTELNGWIGFRYNTTNGFEDIGGIAATACTADGTEVVGIEDLYFPAVWSVGNGAGYLDHLVSATVSTQALGTLSGPVTISPDGSAITALGPDAYLTDQIWDGTWQITLPVPLKVAPIAASVTKLSAVYATPLVEPAGTLTQYADFNTGATAILDRKPSHSASFVFGADGSFTYTPKVGYSNQTDHFTYQLVSPNGTSLTNQVQIFVAAPAPPLVDTPTETNVAATTAILGGTVESDGGAAITGIGVVYAPNSVNSDPQIGGDGVGMATGIGTTGSFTVDVTNLLPNTVYCYAAYATNDVGIAYSEIGYFATAANFVSWQQTWFGDPSSPAAANSADPYGTGVPNYAVFAFLGPYQDPSSATPGMLPQMQMVGGSLTYNFTEPADVSGISYGAQWSATLQPNDWHSIPDTGDPLASPPQHIFSVPASSGSQLFLRLTATIQ